MLLKIKVAVTVVGPKSDKFYYCQHILLMKSA